MTKAATKVKASRKLSDKQKAAAREYLVDHNKTQALIRAGYSAKTAKQAAWRLFTNVYFVEYVTKLLQEQAKRLELDADYVLTNLVEISERCLKGKPVMEYNKETKQLEPVYDEDGNQVWTFDSSGANRANELIGKHLAMFTDVKEVKTSNIDKLLAAIEDDEANGV